MARLQDPKLGSKPLEETTTRAERAAVESHMRQCGVCFYILSCIVRAGTGFRTRGEAEAAVRRAFESRRRDLEDPEFREAVGL